MNTPSLYFFWPVILLLFLLLFGIVALSIWVWQSSSPRAKVLGEKLGFHKADEMERAIQYKATSYAYCVLMLTIVAEGNYRVLIKGEKMPLTILLAMAAIGVQCISILVLRHRNTAGDEEYRAYPFWKTMLWIAVFAAAVAAIGAARMFSAMAH